MKRGRIAGALVCPGFRPDSGGHRRGPASLSQPAGAHHRAVPARRRRRHLEPDSGFPLSDILGQQIVIENRSGASGNLGAEIAAKATPDGDTLFGTSIAQHGVSPALYKKLPYDAVRDFAPISLYGTTPNVLVVHPSVR